MTDLRTIVAATDRRILVPVEIINRTGITPVESERLSDRVSGLVESRDDILGRPPWRQTYDEVMEGIDTETLPLSRWPIEGNPTLSDVHDNLVIFDDPLNARVTGEQRWGVYRTRGWSRPARRNGLTANKVWSPSFLEWKASYTAGYLMPGQVFSWSTGAKVTAGGSRSRGGAPGWALPTDLTNVLAFEADVGGTTGATEPVWPTIVGATIVDNGITWTATAASVLERDLLGFVDAVMQLARSLVVYTDDQCSRSSVTGAPPDPKVFEDAMAAVRAYK